MEKGNKMIKINSSKVFDIVNYVILTVLMLIFLYPIYFTVIASFSEPYDVVSGEVILWFKGFTIESYKQVFKTKEIWVGYKNSIVYTVVGTLFAMFMTMPAAYAMSKKRLWGRGIFSTFFLITMYFGGGLLPTYLLIKNMGLLNQPYTQIVLGAFSVYNMIVARTYFQSSIPESLYEAAEIDGCSQIKQFFMIALPLAKPIIAVLTLYYAVGRWNDFMTSLIYVSKTQYYSLQHVLRMILIQNANALSGIDASAMEATEVEYLLRKQYMAEAMKYSVILIASLPMLIIYPFVQKHFVKGVMIGALKG